MNLKSQKLKEMKSNVDELYWQTFEELFVFLEREPSYEEIQQHLIDKYKTSKEQEAEYAWKGTNPLAPCEPKQLDGYSLFWSRNKAFL